MTRAADPGFDPRIADWLEDDPETAPSIVLETVRAALPSIPQRRRWRPSWRLSPMSRFAVASAAIAIVAVAAALLLFRTGTNQVGGPTASPSVAPTPTATATASNAPSPSITAVLDVGDPRKVLDAGRYQVGTPFDPSFEVTLPDGWELYRLGVNWAEFDTPASTRPDVVANNIDISKPARVYLDPCHPDAGTTEVSSVDEIVGALRSQIGFEGGPVTDTTLGNLAAKTFTLDNSIDTEAANCARGANLPQWQVGVTNEDNGTNGLSHQKFWVLKVGDAPVLVSVTSFDWTTSAERQEGESIGASVSFP